MPLRFSPPFISAHAFCRVAWAAFVLSFATGAVRGLDLSTKPDRYSIDGWFTEEGLPSTRIRAIVQTRDGYLWLATAGGIARFDGIQFTVFTHANEPELNTSNFYDVVEAADGSLWFGANFGLFHYKDGKFKRYDTEQGLPDRYVRSVMFTREGLLVAGTTRGPVFLRDGKVVPHGAEEAWARASDNLRSIRTTLQMEDGSFLFGLGSGLWRQKGAELQKLSGTAGYPEVGYTALVQRPDGKLWLGTTAGLYCRHPDGTLQAFTPAEGLKSPSVECIYPDRDGTLWVGTTGGLFCLRDGKVMPASYPAAFGASVVGNVRESEEGALWVASNAGLFRLKNSPAEAIDQHDGLDQTVVNTVIERQDGSFLIGLWSGGVYRYVGERAARMPELASITSAIYALYEEPDQTLWIGAEYGLYRLAEGKLEGFYSAAQAEQWRKKLAADPAFVLPGLLDSRVYCFVPDGEGGHWIGTIGALYRRKPDGTFVIAFSGRNITVRSVIRARNGDVWAGTAEGVYRLHEGKWRVYATQDGLPKTSARMIFEDTEGTIWAMTPGYGLMRFKDDKWSVYTSRHGLIDDTIVSMMEDEQGYFWLGSSRGIMRVRRLAFAELDVGKLVALPQQTFTRKDGLPDSDCTEPGSPNVWKTRDGRILFPTNRGVAVIKPSQAEFNERKPSIIVEQVVVDGVVQDITKEIAIPPGSRDIAVHFTATSLLAPHKVQFKTQLTPLDRDWGKPDRRRNVHYARLPAGDYVFHVQASNDDGVWNEKPAKLAFRVLPLFYETWWFTTLAITTAIGIGVGSYVWRLRRLRENALLLQRQNAELERRVAERTAELARSYETLRASEYFYHSLVESLPQIIARKDEAGRFTYVNSAFGELHNRPTEQIIGKTDAELYPPQSAAKFRADDVHIMETRQVMEYENVVERPTGKRYLHVKKVPLYDNQNKSIGVQVLFWDMTVFRETEEKLKLAQKELVETSRLAGIAEVATGVLHNIGNALNSVNTSATVALERIRAQKTPNLARVGELLLEQGERVAEFFASDPRAKQIPTYVARLAESLTSEKESAAKEIVALQQNIEHIKQIVAAQQSHARVSGLTEVVPPSELIEYAVRISEASLARHGVTVTREYLPVPEVKVERQKALQILVNLVRNAKEAVGERAPADRRITLGLRKSSSGSVQILVTDNGVGIASENLTRIFAFGFTTKKDGHGFGLHSSALAAKQMGGSLTATSEGPGKGATFILELPPETLAPATAPQELVTV